MPRLDRLLTLYFFRPLLKIIGSREPRVPVLMYHSISEVTSRARHPYYEIRTSLSVFRAQMALLRDAGFTTLFPSEIAPWLASPASSTGRAVCITFDDGYEDFFTSAFPVLQEFGFKSTVYVPTGLVGSKSLNGKSLISWAQIRKLAHAGVNFGSHTVTHPDMKKLTPQQRVCELSKSKQSLEDALGHFIADFSYPFAFPEHDTSYIALLCDNLSRNGYGTGMTTSIGCVRKKNHPLLMPRLPVNLFDDNRFLKAKLNSSYDWLRFFQISVKKFSR